jgi:hypothetical protein
MNNQRLKWMLATLSDLEEEWLKWLEFIEEDDGQMSTQTARLLGKVRERGKRLHGLFAGDEAPGEQVGSKRSRKGKEPERPAGKRVHLDDAGSEVEEEGAEIADEDGVDAEASTSTRSGEGSGGGNGEGSGEGRGTAQASAGNDEDGEEEVDAGDKRVVRMRDNSCVSSRPQGILGNRKTKNGEGR